MYTVQVLKIEFKEKEKKIVDCCSLYFVLQKVISARLFFFSEQALVFFADEVLT